MALVLAVRPFAALTVHELHAMLRLRGDVFVVEQACAYADIDGRDVDAEHLLAAEGDALLGTLRLFAPGVAAADGSAAADGAARIGRVAVAHAARGTGLGRRMMTTALAHIAAHHGAAPVAVSAQAHLEAFYGSLGFVRAGPDELEDGIPHLPMRRPG